MLDLFSLDGHEYARRCHFPMQTWPYNTCGRREVPNGNTLFKFFDKDKISGSAAKPCHGWSSADSSPCTKAVLSGAYMEPSILLRSAGENCVFLEQHESLQGGKKVCGLHLEWEGLRIFTLIFRVTIEVWCITLFRCWSFEIWFWSYVRVFCLCKLSRQPYFLHGNWQASLYCSTPFSGHSCLQQLSQLQLSAWRWVSVLPYLLIWRLLRHALCRATKLHHHVDNVFGYHLMALVMVCAYLQACSGSQDWILQCHQFLLLLL